MLCFSEFPDFRTIGERGTTEIHAMTNARGLPILFPNYTSLSMYHLHKYTTVLPNANKDKG
jgi:hypothetical protein